MRLTIGNSTATPPTQVMAYYHSDLIGSIRAVTDAAGNLSTAARHDYYAFGEEHPQAQHPQAPLTGERQRFAGKQVDPETYLQYFEARYFANRTGRFTSPDPVFPAWARTRPQGWLRYAYALNNPLRFVDPSGLEPDALGEPLLESSSSSSGFSAAGFNGWAEGVYLQGMIQAYADGKISTAQFVGSLPIGLLAALDRAKNESNQRVDNKPGGFRETGFLLLAAGDGSGHVYVPLVPGPHTPSGHGYQMEVRVDPSGVPLHAQSWPTRLIAHVHPHGAKPGDWKQEPSDFDIEQARGWEQGVIGMMYGARSGTIYFYTGQGVLGSISESEFRKVAKK